MKKLTLNLNNGLIKIDESPNPKLIEGYTLVKNIYSVVSPGTEKMLIQFGKQSFIKKFIKNLDRVALVLRKISEEGFKSTYNKIENKLNLPIELGYSTCSIVENTTSKLLKKGDIVVTNGSHGDYSLVKNNLCIKAPANLKKKDLCFSFLASISINAYKISDSDVNSKSAVIGLGIIGSILASYIISEDKSVTTFDTDKDKVEKFENEYNAHFVQKDLKNIDSNFKNNFDVIYLCIENISTNLFYKSCELLKNNGLIVIVGTTKSYFPRDIIYKKSLRVKVAVSYGPGRYDEKFEKGEDLNYIKSFKYSYINNITSFFKKIEQNKIDLNKLSFSLFNFQLFKEAYKELIEKKTSGIIFDYSEIEQKISTNKTSEITKNIKNSNLNNRIFCDIIGTGNHASNVIIPSLIKLKDVHIQNLVSRNNISSNYINKKLNLNSNINNIEGLDNNEFQNNYLFILSDHKSHFEYLNKFYQKRKKIFIEKPLCENYDQLRIIKDNILNKDIRFHINYNRRYSPLIGEISKYFDEKQPTVIEYDIFSNSHISVNKNVNSLKNIIIGEMCHFIDLIQFFIPTSIINNIISCQNYNIFLSLFFTNNSRAKINYYSIENNNLPKEKIRIINGDTYIEINNFQSAKVISKDKIIKIKKNKIEKGFKESIDFFFNNVISKNYSLQIIQNSEISIESFNKIKNSQFEINN